jgi:peptidoglycan/xylan/chitin deacetylase (PgdA/CDA1 family)
MILKARKVLSNVLNFSGITYLLNKIGNRKTLILVYHRVLDINSNFKYDKSLVSCSVQNFENQMNYLSEKYNVISLEKFLEYYKKNQNPPKNTVVITFDDGYKDNYTNAYPVLRNYDFPATIFLATDAVENKRLFWWDRISYMVSKTKVKRFELNEIGKFSLISKDAKFNSLKFIQKNLKKLTDSERNKVIEKISKLLKVDCPFFESENNLFLSWNEIKKMQQNNISFGAHTKSHSILAKIPLKKANEEIKDSKKIIEKRLGKKIKFFCCPNGYEGDFNENIKKLVKKNGFDCAVSYIPGANSINSDLFELRRVFVRNDENISLFKTKLIGVDIVLAKIYLFFVKSRGYIEDLRVRND